MSLINSVDRITRQLEQNNALETKKEEKRRQDERLLKDIIAECNAFIYEKIINDDEDDIILNIDENIGLISDIIKNKTEIKKIEVVEGNEWKVVKKELPCYEIYNEYEFENVIREIYYKEYTKLKKEIKLKQEILTKYVKIKLEKYFRKAFKLDGNKKSIYNQLLKNDIKSDVINYVSEENKEEINLLNTIYNKTLNEVLKEYKGDIETYNIINRQRSKNNYNGVLLFGVMSLFGINSNHKYKYKRRR